MDRPRVHEKLKLNPGKLAYLPVELADVMRQSLADAMHSVFLLLPVLTALSLLATIFIKPLKLRDTLAQPEDRGREILDSTAMSSPDKERMLSPEDEQTIRRQIQEMLHIEKIFDEDGIQGEIDAYEPLIPDGSNWKATMLIELPTEISEFTLFSASR